MLRGRSILRITLATDGFLHDIFPCCKEQEIAFSLEDWRRVTDHPLDTARSEPSIITNHSERKLPKRCDFDLTCDARRQDFEDLIPLQILLARVFLRQY